MGAESAAYALLAITAVKTVSETVAAQAQNAAIERSKESLMQSYQNQTNTQTLQQNQVNAQATDQMNRRAMQAREQMARLRVAAGESGVGGVSVNNIENAANIDTATDIATMQNNRQGKINQIQMEKEGVRSRTSSQLAQLDSQKKDGSWLSAGLKIGGSYAMMSYGGAFGGGGTAGTTAGQVAPYGGTWTANGPFDGRTYTGQIYD